MSSVTVTPLLQEWNGAGEAANKPILKGWILSRQSEGGGGDAVEAGVLLGSYWDLNIE